jgi:hypothetical protein
MKKKVLKKMKEIATLVFDFRLYFLYMELEIFITSFYPLHIFSGGPHTLMFRARLIFLSTTCYKVALDFVAR